jgi:putative glutamine amidotransferase
VHTGDPDHEQRDDQYRTAVRQYGAQTLDVRPGHKGLDLAAVDGVLLAGGGDLEPWRYAAPDSGRCRDVDPERDETELCLTRAALRAGLPVLGICRGAQVLGVALGGQLVQRIGSKPANAEKHSVAGKEAEAGHWVEIAAGSRLARIIGAGRIRVNSSHHQANARLGPGVSPAACCDDGVIEAIEVDGAAFAIGVQWHPERMLESESSQRLFRAFVHACRAGRRQREAASAQ